MAIDTKSFIDDARLKGMSDNAIKSALLNMGVAAAEVNTHFPAFVMQSQPQPQVAMVEEVQPKAAIPQEVKSQAVMREQVQPQAIASQGVQPQATSPQQVQPEIAPLPRGLPSIDSAPGNQPATSAMSTTPVGAPRGVKETVMQNVGTFGTQPANPSTGAPVTSPVFGNQQPITAAQPSVPASKSKKPLAIIIAAILILGGVGAGYFFLTKNKASNLPLAAETLVASTTATENPNGATTSIGIGATTTQTVLDQVEQVKQSFTALVDAKTEVAFNKFLSQQTLADMKEGGFVFTGTSIFSGATFVSGNIETGGQSAVITANDKRRLNDKLYFLLENNVWKFDDIRSREPIARDAMRVADLRRVQVALELYYNKHGQYPPTSDWVALIKTLTESNVVGTMPISNDPSAPAKTYYYGSDTNGTTYILGAKLEDIKNSILEYSIAGVPTGIKISGITCAKTLGEYCMSL